MKAEEAAKIAQGSSFVRAMGPEPLQVGGESCVGGIGGHFGIFLGHGLLLRLACEMRCGLRVTLLC
jgi:hypothetical protein